MNSYRTRTDDAVATDCGALAGYSSAAAPRRKPKPQPIVTVQTAPVERGTIQQIITAEAILFPHDQAAITPKVVRSGQDVLRELVAAACIAASCWPCWRIAILAAAEVENKGAYEQAQATYGLETNSALAGRMAEGRARPEDREGSL